MKLTEKELAEIEAAAIRLDDSGFEFYPIEQKDTDDGYWNLWHTKDGIEITEYGKYKDKNDENAERTFEKDRTRDQLLAFLKKTEVAAESCYDDRTTSYEQFAKENSIFPLETIILKIPRPLAQKFNKIIASDPEIVQKYVLDSVIERIKDDAENYAFSE